MRIEVTYDQVNEVYVAQAYESSNEGEVPVGEKSWGKTADWAIFLLGKEYGRNPSSFALTLSEIV